ncbi:MAG TPA: hypothetical protein VGL76_01715 [Gaiellaceae bacterium]
MIVEAERLRNELERAGADAALEPDSFAVWIVDASRPPRATPIAYLQPAGRVTADTVLVFRAVGAERVEPFRERAHRLALWRELPGLPEAALGPMLRHELEHARRFELSGPAFYECDERLRAQFGADSYAALPTEREANAAAAAYARRALTAAALEELQRVPELAGMLAAEPPADVVATTLALLGESVELAPAIVGRAGLTIELVAPV